MGWGLAMSGGGLLGAAHLGVLRAFTEWGIWPDVLSGTSAGGLVAGVLSAGGRLEDLTAYGAKISVHPLRYLRPQVWRLLAELLPHDPLLPANSLLNSTPFVRGLVALCPSKNIQSWRQPTAVTALDLATLEAVAFVRPPAAGLVGPRGAWRAVTAADLQVALQSTMAQPGVYSAVRANGGFLVDGGGADTLPVDWAAALGAERVVAVDVSPPTPGVPPRAGIFWSLLQSNSYSIATLSKLREPATLPVLSLVPNLQGISGWDFSAYGRVVQAGYAEAVRRKEEILAFVAGTPAASGAHR